MHNDGKDESEKKTVGYAEICNHYIRIKISYQQTKT